MIINPEQFALSVVSSSDPSLSVEEKLLLYTSAYDSALKFLQELRKASQSNQNTEEMMKAIRKLFSH